MIEDLWDSIEPIRRLLGGLVVLAIAWYAFEAVIQPVLVYISPIFADQGEYWTGRYPNTPAQAALLVTLWIGIYAYYTLIILINKDIDKFAAMWKPFFRIPISLVYLSYRVFYFSLDNSYDTLSIEEIGVLEIDAIWYWCRGVVCGSRLKSV